MLTFKVKFSSFFKLETISASLWLCAYPKAHRSLSNARNWVRVETTEALICFWGRRLTFFLDRHVTSCFTEPFSSLALRRRETKADEQPARCCFCFFEGVGLTGLFIVVRAVCRLDCENSQLIKAQHTKGPVFKCVCVVSTAFFPWLVWIISQRRQSCFGLLRIGVFKQICWQVQSPSRDVQLTQSS